MSWKLVIVKDNSDTDVLFFDADTYATEQREAVSEAFTRLGAPSNFVGAMVAGIAADLTDEGKFAREGSVILNRGAYAAELIRVPDHPNNATTES